MARTDDGWWPEVELTLLTVIMVGIMFGMCDGCSRSATSVSQPTLGNRGGLRTCLDDEVGPWQRTADRSWSPRHPADCALPERFVVAPPWFEVCRTEGGHPGCGWGICRCVPGEEIGGGYEF
jgi:hypothetical protein